MLIRLNKYIAECGVCSRRKADELIENGKVKVNKVLVTNLGVQIDELNDSIEVNDRVIHKEEKKVYIMLNKPEGYITTNSEQFGRKATSDLIKEDIRVFPIGRLDRDTEGLLLFTNDGKFANYMMHPSHMIKKTYIVTTDSNITSEKINKLKNGVDIGGYITKEAEVRKYSSNKLEIIISEGKNRQVRKMCKAVGINVKKLERVKIGEIGLGSLKLGEYRYLKPSEIKKLK